MALTPYTETLLRRSIRLSSPAEDSIMVDTTPQLSRQAAENTTPS